MKVLNGILYLLKVGHEVTDPTKAMIEIAQDARRFNISMIEVEPNFGQGMWVAAFQPILERTWKGGATVQESEGPRVRKRPGSSTPWSRCSPSIAWSSLRVSRARTPPPRTQLRLPLPAHPHHPRPRGADAR